MRIAIVHKDKCKPDTCAELCKKVCPVNRKDEECIKIEGTTIRKAAIDEELCIGCGICQNRCPFEAIEIVNLPETKEENLVYRYGENQFALYGLPTPRENSILGLLGRNGTGKSTTIKILAGKEKINLGKENPTEKEIKSHLQGSELMRYFENLKDKKIALKPQNLSFLSSNITVIDLLKQRGKEKRIKELIKKLEIENILEKKLNILSGGELQKIAIIATCLSEADIYFFDEPLAFLDIAERIRVSDFIEEVCAGKTVIVVEHDLLMLDYLTEFVNVFYGRQGCFGLVSGIKSTRYGINSYLEGFLKEENLKIRSKALNFNFIKNLQTAGNTITTWPAFKKKYKGFTLEVEEGEIKENSVVGILGRNGTGKSAFVKCLAGLEEVEIEGNKNPEKLNLKLEISYKPQKIDNNSDELVMEIIKKDKIKKDLVATFNLEMLAQKKIKELSGGELQRLEIAKCLAKNADIYLIDEPSAYLDVEERISTAKTIKDAMITRQKTAFVIDHDLLLISYLADSIITFSGEPGKKGIAKSVTQFEKGITALLKELNITLRKDKDYGRPRINNKDSVLDREQKSEDKWVEF